MRFARRGGDTSREGIAQPQLSLLPRSLHRWASISKRPICQVALTIQAISLFYLWAELDLFYEGFRETCNALFALINLIDISQVLVRKNYMHTWTTPCFGG